MFWVYVRMIVASCLHNHNEPGIKQGLRRAIKKHKITFIKQISLQM